jgi:hypothetical protein
MMAGRKNCFTASDRQPLGVDAADERYFDLDNYHPKGRPGQTWAEARLEQVAAIEAQNRETVAISDSSPPREARRYLGWNAVGSGRARAQSRSGWVAEAALISQLQCGDKRLKDIFSELVPLRPYCTDDLADGLIIRPRTSALKKRYLQVNGPGTVRWLVYDLDYRGVVFAHRDANLPPPNFLAINPKNGHAHAGILLEVPVARHSAARAEPLNFLAAVERGIARRLRADMAYAGLIAKNPLHLFWEVLWVRDAPYSLPELDSWLFKEDKRPYERLSGIAGHSRNCAVFDKLREHAYREVLNAKRAGKSVAEFQAYLQDRALELNRAFTKALPLSEIRAIAKSVAKWTWRKFSDDGFRRRQSERGKRGNKKRWANHVAAEKTKPWVREGISKATYYRRKSQSKSTS